MMADAFNDAGASLSALCGRAALQERAHGTRGAAGQVQRLPANVHARAKRTAPLSCFEEAGAFGLPRPHEPARHPPHLRSVLPDHHEVAGGKKQPNFRPSRTRSCQPKRATCLNSTNFGALWATKRTRCGCGWRFAEEPARSWLGRWVTAACKARVICGQACRRATAGAPRAVTIGMPTQRLFQPGRIALAASKRVRPATSNASLAPCGPEPAA